ncbi:unnamed protein product, partial [Symbiodinium microadriaticum]
PLPPGCGAPPPPNPLETAENLLEIACATIVALNEMGADVQSEDVAQDLRQIQRLILEGSRQFHTARRARDWAAVHGGENYTERASEVCSNLVEAINSAPPGHPPYVLDAMERLLYLTNEANLLHQQAWGTNGEEERDLATAEEYRPLRKRARHQADVISHGGGPDTQPETLPEPRQELPLMAMRKLRRLMPFLTGDTQSLASEALQDLCQWSMQFWGDVVFLVESDQEEEEHLNHYLDHLSELYHTIQYGLYYQTQQQNKKNRERHHLENYLDKKPENNEKYQRRRRTTRRRLTLLLYQHKASNPHRNYLKERLDYYLNHLWEPYHTNRHDLYYPTQHFENYLVEKPADHEKYQRRRRTTGRRPTTPLNRHKASNLFRELHAETKIEGNPYRRGRRNQRVKGPRDWGNLDHYRDNDLYPDTEHNNTTKDYLNYQRRRHSKRRRQKYHQRAGRPEDHSDLYLDTERNNTTKDYLDYQRRRHSTRRRQKYHQRAGRPEDQGYLRKNYSLGNLDQGHQ